MSEQHRELIKKCQAQFIQAIVDTQCLGPLIYQLSSRDESGDSALTLQDTISIAVEYTNEAEKVRAVLEILCTRGPNAIDRFFKAIVDNKQSRLISVLTSQWPPNRQTGNERTSDHSSAPVPSNTRICSFDPNSSVQVGHVQDGTQHNYRAQGSIYSDDASEQRYAQDNRNNQGFQNNGPVSGGRFDQKIIYGANAEGCTINNQNIQGSMMGGPVRGGIVNIGDHHYYQQELRQVPSTSSIPSQPSTEDWQKKLET
uniref:CARD domain-containing protein n=1 Tax=Plectus sambesii TaxID=2011161 RepID=A0A914WVC6_9BILA